MLCIGLAFCVCSILMTFSNKLLEKTHHYPIHSGMDVFFSVACVPPD